MPPTHRTVIEAHITERVRTDDERPIRQAEASIPSVERHVQRKGSVEGLRADRLGAGSPCKTLRHAANHVLGTEGHLLPRAQRKNPKGLGHIPELHFSSLRYLHTEGACANARVLHHHIAIATAADQHSVLCGVLPKHAVPVDQYKYRHLSPFCLSAISPRSPRVSSTRPGCRLVSYKRTHEHTFDRNPLLRRDRRALLVASAP